jgi:hypothetical protein
MSVKLQFVKDGKTIEYTLDGDVTIEVQTAPPFGETGASITLQNASLTVAGDAPWSGVELEVAIPSLNVRDSKAARGEPAAKVLQGDKLTVSSTSSVIGNLTWRQIYKPDDLFGKWVAEKYKDNVYLAPVGTVQIQTAIGGQAATQGVTVDRGTDTPAPLTGRFQLVQRKGPHGTYTALSIDGDPTPKMGVNVRELAYFGTSQWQYTNEAWLGNYAAEAAAMGMKWVRFFAAHRNYTDDQIVNRIRKVLDVLASHNLIAIVCFADSLSEKGMFPKGDEQWHSGSRGHYVKDYFNNKNYQTNYLPLVKRIVSEFKGHKAVGMWQLMNELAIYDPPANDNDVKGFSAFVDEVSEAIYTLDSTHPISIGIINTAHIMPPGKDLKTFARDFYRKRKFIHAATSHVYQLLNDLNPQVAWEFEDYCALDADVANETGRAMLWTEFGAGNNADRRASTERFLDRHLVKGTASAALQWGFMLTLGGMTDTGVGDGNYGFSPGLNKQYDNLKDLFVNVVKKA